MTALPDLPIPADLAYDGPEPLSEWEIDTYADHLADEVEIPEEARWSITDDGAAEWALRKTAFIDDDLARLAEQMQGWKDRIEAWFTNATAPLHRRRDFFVFHLERYAFVQRIEQDRKTITLPSGTVKSRESKAAAVVSDEAAVIAWAKKNLTGDELTAVVKVVESVQVSGLRGAVNVSPDGERVVASGGEVVPGCEVRPASVSFTVTT